MIETSVISTVIVEAEDEADARDKIELDLPLSDLLVSVSRYDVEPSFTVHPVEDENVIPDEKVEH